MKVVKMSTKKLNVDFTNLIIAPSQWKKFKKST